MLSCLLPCYSVHQTHLQRFSRFLRLSRKSIFFSSKPKPNRTASAHTESLAAAEAMAVLLSSGSLPSTRTKLRPMLFQDSVIEGNSTPTSRLLTGELSKQSLLPRNTLFTGMRKNSGENDVRLSLIALSAKSKHTIQETQKYTGKNLRKAGGKPILSEGRDEDESYGQICPGCGVYMQDEDPNLPGYYEKRKLIQTEMPEDQEDMEGLWGDELGSEEDDAMDDIESKFEGSEGEKSSLESEDGDEFDWDSDEWELELEGEDDDMDLDGFAPAGVGYGNITEETIKKGKKKRISKSEKKRMAREAEKDREEVTVCARCHSLRNYGQVKHQMAENLIPDFDFDRLIATRLMKPTGNADATVVVMVVDCVDFDGSFPKRAAKSLFKALEGYSVGGKVSRKLPKLVLVATKVDLLPSQISPTRLDRWVRNRAKAGGAPKLSGVYLVSARKDLGVRNLLSFVKELAGPRGNVWVIGAQNAGKSTLINTFAKREGVKITKLTEAAVPGTTLGILRIGGILSAKAKMYDTPGLLHPYLMSMRLNRDEQKMVEIRKELQPRTYRMKVGQAVHVGGLMRLDLNQASVETIYVTIWVSLNVSLHMGKIENADEIWRKHVGVRLQPPVGVNRVSEIGKWEEQEIKVSGVTWDVNSLDIAVAGLGWFSLGLKGNATLALWTYDGIEVTLREPLVLDRAPFLERPGFWLPKAISDAIGQQSRLEVEKRKRGQEESTEYLSEMSA